MSFPTSLVPAARSAYRSVFRAARVTFQDDPTRFAQMMAAVRPTFQSPTLTNPAQPPPVPLEGPAPDLSSPEEISKRIQEWNEVAAFLRKNVVQGRLDEQSGTYSELGVRERRGTMAGWWGIGMLGCDLCFGALQSSRDSISQWGCWGCPHCWCHQPRCLPRPVADIHFVSHTLSYLPTYTLHPLTAELRVTEDTEIGSNDSLKTPAPMPVTPFPNRNKTRRRTPAPKCGE